MKKNLKLLSLVGLLAVIGCGDAKKSPTEQSNQPTSGNENQSVEVVSNSGKESGEIQSQSDVKVETYLHFTHEFEDSGDGVYKVTKNPNEIREITVDFEKKAGAEWANLVAEIDSSFAASRDFNCLRFTISGDCKVLIKIESKEGGAEINLKLTEAAQSYEWAFSENDKKIIKGENAKVLIFALPGAAEGTGQFKLFDVALDTEFTDEPYPITTGYTNIKATVSEYDGTSATFSFNQYWMENDANSYKFEDKEDGSVEVTFNQASSWQFAYTQFTGAQSFEYITLKLHGDEGRKILFKVEPQGADVKETWVTLTGGQDVFTFDLSNYTEDQRANIGRLLMFAEGGAAEQVKGKFTIDAAYFTHEREQAEVVPPVVEASPLYGRVLNVPVDQLVSLDEGVYTLEDKVLSWNKGEGGEWQAAVIDKVKIGNEYTALATNAASYTRLYYDVALDEGHKLMLKLEGAGFTALEKEIDATSKGYLALTGDLSKVEKVVVFGDPNVANTQGKATINELRFEARTPATIDENGLVNLKDGAPFDLGDRVYDVTQNADGSFKVVTKEGKGDWSCFGIRVSALEKKYNYATITASGDAADALLAKVENDAGNAPTYEKKIDALGEHVTVTLDLSQVNTSDPEDYIFVFFANPGATKVAKEIVIEKIEFHDEAAPVVEVKNIVNKGYGRYLEGSAENFKSLDDGVYQVKDKTISWNKGAGSEWQCAVATVENGAAGFTRLEYDVTLKDEKPIMIKVEGAGFAPIEKKIETSGKGYLDLSGIDASLIEKIVFFGNPNEANVSGEATINMLRFGARKEATNNGGTVDLNTGSFFDLGDGVYEIHQGNSIEVTAKEGKGDWSCFGVRVKAGDYARVEITVTSDSMELPANSILCKVEDDAGGVGANEQRLDNLSHNEQKATLSLTGLVDAEYYLLVFFINPGTNTPSTGKVFIDSIQFLA